MKDRSEVTRKKCMAEKDKGYFQTWNTWLYNFWSSVYVLRGSRHHFDKPEIRLYPKPLWTLCCNLPWRASSAKRNSSEVCLEIKKLWSIILDWLSCVLRNRIFAKESFIIYLKIFLVVQTPKLKLRNIPEENILSIGFFFFFPKKLNSFIPSSSKKREII